MDNPPQLSDKTLSELIAVQAADVQVRSKELDLRSKEIEVNARNAEKSIAAQLEVEKLRQQAFLSHTKYRAWLIGGGIASTLIVIVAAIWLDKDGVAMEILKQGALLIGGFAGGYATKSAQGEGSKGE